ncbi:hypothetical protein N9V82_02235 [Candidatus Poseidoniales archaeon]|nr:hypothetical protein [Candidatus Poseidoniales archaeon]
MTTDKVFILLLVIMLPLTGCLDVTDTAEAEESEEETTIVNNYYNNTTTIDNNYYNNTTTIVQSVEPQMVHMYAYTENISVGTITINENQTIEWLSSSSLIERSGGSFYGPVSSAVQISDISCIDSYATYYGGTSGGFALKGEGECTYTLFLNHDGYFYGAHNSIVYLIHEL